MLKRSVRRRLVNLARAAGSAMFLQGNAKTGGVRLGLEHNSIFIPLGYSFRTVAIAEQHAKRLTGRKPRRWEIKQRQAA